MVDILLFPRFFLIPNGKEIYSHNTYIYFIVRMNKALRKNELFPETLIWNISFLKFVVCSILIFSIARSLCKEYVCLLTSFFPMTSLKKRY